MRRFLYTLLSLATALTAGAADIVQHRTPGSITFTVDENLPAPRVRYVKLKGSDVAEYNVSRLQIESEYSHVVACSFAEDNLIAWRQNVLFSCLRQAYADHRPVVLSPDMVWLAVSQGFARFVNAHAEQLRSRLVSHEQKQELVVTTADDLLAEGADWSRVVGDFAAALGRHTNEHIAEIITADFSTTGAVERIASQVTLMDAFKAFFDYKAVYIVCGIPSITLQGTPDDWRRLQTKTRQLADYGLQEWVAQLEPVLAEFVKAAEGQPDQRFWQDIVSRKHPDELRGGGCSREPGTPLDGWFLKLFPDDDGHTKAEVPYDYHDMPTDLSTAAFRYLRVGPGGELLDETSMELVAGFVGIDEDDVTHTLTPRIGWLVRQSSGSEEMLLKLHMANAYSGNGIKMRVAEVPLELSQLPKIQSLDIEFTGPVVLPEWLDSMEINQLIVRGRMTDDEAAQLRKRFPKGQIVSTGKATKSARAARAFAP
jgi:hypothetical protein